MMSASKGRKIETRGEYWRGRIAEQERSGQSVHMFCKAHGLTEQSFYLWRKRLRQQDPVRFAVLEREPARQSTMEHSLELVLTTGERLRIRSGVDGAMLRAVLEALRA